MPRATAATSRSGSARELSAAGVAVVSGSRAAWTRRPTRPPWTVPAERSPSSAAAWTSTIPASTGGCSERLAAAGGCSCRSTRRASEPRPQNFPIRNRIIAGLSSGVVVVEASRRSGSLITARLAADFGRDVFAVPGSIFSETSAGAHALLRDGAILCTGAEDVLAELFPMIGGGQRESGAVAAADVAALRDLSVDAGRLLEAITRDESLSADELVARARPARRDRPRRSLRARRRGARGRRSREGGTGSEEGER